MVFRKRGGLQDNEIWTYKGSQLEVINEFNYLGTVFKYTGSFVVNQETLVGKCLKTLNCLQKVRGKLLLNRIAFIDCNENS